MAGNVDCVPMWWHHDQEHLLTETNWNMERIFVEYKFVKYYCRSIVINLGTGGAAALPTLLRLQCAPHEQQERQGRWVVSVDRIRIEHNLVDERKCVGGDQTSMQSRNAYKELIMAGNPAMNMPIKFELNLISSVFCKYTETPWPIRGQEAAENMMRVTKS